MPRGFTNCRICGKRVISVWRAYHETVQCLRMRYLRGDTDVKDRFHSEPKPVKPNVVTDLKQLQLLKYLDIEKLYVNKNKKHLVSEDTQ